MAAAAAVVAVAAVVASAAAAVAAVAVVVVAVTATATPAAAAVTTTTVAVAAAVVAVAVAGAEPWRMKNPGPVGSGFFVAEICAARGSWEPPTNLNETNQRKETLSLGVSVSWAPEERSV